MSLESVPVGSVSLDRLRSEIGSERTAHFEAIGAVARERLAGRLVLNVNSTAAGGGVAELLQTLLAYARGAGIDARWVVIEGDPEFFAITKRIHNHLYGSNGDGGTLGAAEHRRYEATMDRQADALVALIRPGDVVLLHDPQTAGLAGRARAAGASVLWRCHVGIDTQNDESEQGWEFLRPYLDDVSAFVFSREQFAPSWVPKERLAVIPPSIDPFSAKNEPMSEHDVVSVLRYAGLLAGEGQPPAGMFTSRDGTSAHFARHVGVLQTGPPPPADVPLVLQASRWDSMKDMEGVMAAFAEHLPAMGSAHLVLAGPNVDGVADDPEAADVLQLCLSGWQSLPEPARSRIHLACVPMAGADAPAIVNALQRHAAVVAQKSLAEGFGLTVVEAMWKGRPVVGSAVGGIVDQIIPGETGRLVDPYDLAAFADAVAGLVADPDEAARMGANGREFARQQFLGDRHLEQWAHLIVEHLR